MVSASRVSQIFLELGNHGCNLVAGFGSLLGDEIEILLSLELLILHSLLLLNRLPLSLFSLVVFLLLGKSNAFGDSLEGLVHLLLDVF